jgi:hypothetical protein
MSENELPPSAAETVLDGKADPATVGARVAKAAAPPPAILPPEVTQQVLGDRAESRELSAGEQALAILWGE